MKQIQVVVRLYVCMEELPTLGTGKLEKDGMRIIRRAVHENKESHGYSNIET